MVRCAVNYSDLIAGAELREEPLNTYHKGYNSRERKTADRDRNRELRQSCRASAEVIAWDGEGIDLFGKGKPQSYVLFGCSAYPDSPLVLNDPKTKLTHKQLCKYICDVGSRHPGAIHIGYGFAYDQNMIIQTMPLKWKERLYYGKWVQWPGTDGFTYKLKIEWRKRLKISRVRPDQTGRTTVYIDDISAFFHSSFVKAYQQIVGEGNEDWSTVTEGKAARGNNEWEQLSNVITYWRVEILALAELGSTFRDLFYSAGFALTSWYGPGALANYLRQREGLSIHEFGGKESNLPKPVHAATKSAFYGGRFEQFQLGRITGPIYSLDINSAYPYAFTKIPSLAKGGFWNHVTDLKRDTFSVYYVRYADAENINKYGIPMRSREAHPLPYRDSDSQISYPAITEGWYWEPEVSALSDCLPGCLTIVEGWQWVPGNEQFPWKNLMERMFTERRELKRRGDSTEIAYKLGINSLYGKMAQRVGWDRETKKPPKSHTLPIAGYVTSYCRAMIMRVVFQIPVEKLIAIETDGIYTTVNPAHLVLPTGMGDWLGQWELETYDEMYYVQNGVYYARKGSEWVKAKSRGFSSTLVSPESIAEYLQSLEPRTRFPAMQVLKPVSSFIGIGSALQRARNGKGNIIPTKAMVLHCQWEQSYRVLIPGGKGKRIHVPHYCDACQQGFNGYDMPHTLLSNHGAIKVGFDYVMSGGESEQPSWNPVSQTYRLPWETDKLEAWRIKAQEDEERIEQELLGKMPELPIQ